MKDVLRHLYNGELNEAERKVTDLYETEEYKQSNESYERLAGTFSQEQSKLFEEYFEKNGLYTAKVMEEIYANGFKTGMLLAFEVADFEPTI